MSLDSTGAMDGSSEVIQLGQTYYYDASLTHYLQRVYSLSLGWCYFTSLVVTDSPLSTETTPNHAGDLVSGKHSVIKKVSAILGEV